MESLEQLKTHKNILVLFLCQTAKVCIKAAHKRNVFSFRLRKYNGNKLTEGLKRSSKSSDSVYFLCKLAKGNSAHFDRQVINVCILGCKEDAK